MEDPQRDKQNMFLGASRLLFERSRSLRKNETSAEQLLWSRLSNKQLGVKFRRQHPLHHYIADFYCHSHRLVIELDGPIHDTLENKSNDKARDAALLDFNIRTIRFANDEVYKNIDAVVEKIKRELDCRGL